ncbi:vWA domain-containing protein [Novosphingobium sp.]|uniref:vWA domain-containing protein n=1 Tax=Novosphingobium sp. TaxID=1874826 RepID=UPI002630107B|nr:vWA domain-containing protein [Novosphingobium sp.]
MFFLGGSLLALAACSEKAPESAAGAPAAKYGIAEEEAAVDLAAPPPPASIPAARSVTRKTEWNVGGLVSGKTETTMLDPVAPPPVVIEPPAMPTNRVDPQSGLLTAGDVDYLLNPGQYAAYAGRFLQASGQSLPFYDTRSRVVIRVVDARGRPVPFAKAEVGRPGAPLHLLTAADGTASFYPRPDRIPQKTSVAVTGSAGSAQRAVAFSDGRVIEIALPGVAAAPRAMDLALVIDTTGSMGDEMAYIQAELDTIVARLKRNAGQIDLRIGVVLYRDEGDDYVVQSTPLTGNIGSIRTLLARQDADGGGDTPEAMDRAVTEAGRLQWRADAAKAVLLVTDAPPHADAIGATLDATQQLRSRGVQIVPVAASGVEDSAQYVLRSMAALTQGRYIFLTDDSGVGNSHAEPDVACYLVSRLDTLVARVLAGIATGRRVEPREGDVIRTVGDYDRGRCHVAQQGGQDQRRQQG